MVYLTLGMVHLTLGKVYLTLGMVYLTLGKVYLTLGRHQSIYQAKVYIHQSTTENSWFVKAR